MLSAQIFSQRRATRVGRRTDTEFLQFKMLTLRSADVLKVLTALVLERRRRNPRRQQREVTMTADESNGGTEQPAAEQEAPAVTEQQAAPQPAELVAEQPPAEQAAVSPAEPEAEPTSDDAPTP
jgi:hypothetical protein